MTFIDIQLNLLTFKMMKSKSKSKDDESGDIVDG